MSVKQTRFIAALVTVAVLSIPTVVPAVPHVIFTVDVESSETFELPQQINPVCKDGSPCGVMEIARKLKDRGWSGTFFLNVYEYKNWGETAMRQVAMDLQTASQDVALHTHPQWSYDPSRNGMFQYSLDEQSAIISDGMKLLASWTGQPVSAHRAGDYAADARTLNALERNGLHIDSSLFLGHPHCRLNGLGLPYNLPTKRGRVTEIPVTVYQREERPQFFSELFAPVKSIRKIDVDWFIDREEAKAAIEAVVKADLPFLVVFMHSFSFMDKKRNDVEPSADCHAIDIFETILDTVAEKHLPVVTMRDLVKFDGLATITRVKDVLPQVTVRVALPRYLWHRMHITATTKLLMWGMLLASIALGLVAALIGRRKMIKDYGTIPRQNGRSAANSEQQSP